MEKSNEFSSIEKSNKSKAPDGFSDFFSFRKMISTTFIQVIYIIGSAAIIIVGLLRILTALNGGDGLEGAGIGLALLIFGNIIWRIFCEVWILFFRIAESISNIEKSCKK